MPLRAVERDWGVFAREGATAVGAVRQVRPDRLVIYVEGYGDVTVGPQQVASAEEGKVVLALDALPPELRAAVERAHDQESDEPEAGGSERDWGDDDGPGDDEPERDERKRGGPKREGPKREGPG